MSATIRRNSGNQLTTDYDLKKIFLWNNRYETDNYVNNSSYNPITLIAGTVMGKIASTNVLVPCYSGAIDGSQKPIGILAQDLVAIPGGSTVKASICIAGDVAESEVDFFYTGDTLETVVGSGVEQRRYRDRIASDTVGIVLRTGTEMTGIDN